jgi:cardiolipin synthase (CMP-forming)
MLFVEEYLQDLRQQRFAPRALALYLRRVVGRARDAMVANPGAVRSIWLVGLLFFVAAFLASVEIALHYDRHLAYDFMLQTSLWILPAFALVSFNVDHLRDREGFALSGLNLPTVLTLLRVALVPGIALFLLERHFALAFVTFLIAALSDVADGWLARRLKQETLLGKALDPVVDIVFNLAMFFALASSRLLPTWVFAMAALRYGLLLVGGAGLYLFVGPLRIRPTSFGRATGVVMSSLLALLLWLRAVEDRVSQRLVPLTETALGVLLLATVIQVVAMGWYNLKVMRGEARAQGRVVGDVRWGAQ